MSISNRYSPADTEDKWYKYWMDKKYFRSTPDDREPYTIVIPPPNVTGILHMGHMLNNTIQDVLIRKARLDGKNACWVPGMDHASIATEAKVVRWLRSEKGLTKGDLTRDEYMEYAWQWKEKYGGIILEQLKKLGASCDWDREAFTMDEVRSRAVMKTFVKLYKRGKLYRGLRMVNWDPKAKTVLSNEEVIYHNESGQLYHVKYKIDGGDYVTIATTRPETILADTAIAVHPEDDRYKHLRGKFAYVPLLDRKIPIIHDDYVEMEFGTGALKVTPAHDPNDYEIGKRHKLDVIDIFNDDATLNEKAGLFIGSTREEARKAICEKLEEVGQLEKVEDYTHNVGRSERTNAVVEPKLSLQWYVRMGALAEPALKAVMEDDVRFYPENQKNIYRHWMENIRDWCISRQLWWGHRIPAWYLRDEIFVAETAQEALDAARSHFNDNTLELEDLRQDEDVLDTWFSSWLWPISVFDGFENEEELNYYYPTSTLVTGWDIIFLWVARMVMAGYEFLDKRPFDAVYFTGMVRDKQRRKMSKSLGNSPDPLELIKEYGADGVRFGLLSSSPAGGDLLFDVKLCEQGSKFCNKVWNALRFLKSYEVNDEPQGHLNAYAVKWMRNNIHAFIKETNKDYEQFRLADILMKLYSLIWDDYCSWFVEIIKPKGDSIDRTTSEAAVDIFSQLCQLLHPFMPFISEEIWHQLRNRAEGEDCIVSSYPEAREVDDDLLVNFKKLQALIRKIRELRNKYGISMKEEVKLQVEESSSSKHLFEAPERVRLLEKMGRIGELELVAHGDEQAISFLSGTDKYFVHFDLQIDVEAERSRLNADLERAEGFVRSVEKKLSNERFVSNAPEAVVEKERKKLSDGKERIRIIQESLDKLN